MSRAFSPILSSASTAPWTRTLGIFAAEGGYVVDDDGATLEHRRLTVVLSFDASARQRTLHSALTESLRYVAERYQLVQLADAAAQLTRFFDAYEPVSVNVVVILPDDAKALPTDVVDDALAAVRAASSLHIETIAAVAESPRDWEAVRGIDYYVGAGNSGTHRAGLSLYRIFAALMAPEALLEVDADEIQSFLGTASAPSFLLHAEWEPASEVLRLSADSDASALKRAHASLLTILIAEPSPSLAKQVMRQWSSLCPSGALVAGSATVGFFEPGWQADDVPQRVVALCHERSVD